MGLVKEKWFGLRERVTPGENSRMEEIHFITYRARGVD